MAKKLKPDDGPATKNHNSAEIKKTIQEVAGKVIALKAERGEINAQITEAKARVKAFGIKMIDFNAVLRLHELEAEDRNESIDNIRIMFDALEIGGQGSLFVGDAPVCDPEKPSRADKLRAKADGKDAGLNAKHAGENPHPKGTPLHDPWYKGWMAGQAEIAGRMKGNGNAKAPEPQPAA